MYDLIIQNVTVVDPHGGGADVRPGHDIGIQANRITAVRPSGGLADAAAAEILVGDGMAALPGLINTHAHAAMVLFRGAAEDVPIDTWFNEYIWTLESNLDGDDVYWGALLAMAEMIESGVTTVADHYFAMDMVAQAAEQSGMRAHLAPTLFGADAQAELAASEAFAARWHGAAGGRITAWLGPHAPYTCPPAFLREVADAARRLGLGCHIHASETAAQVQQSVQTHGVTPIRLLEQLGFMDSPLLVAHATHATPDDIALLAQHGASVAHCPKTFLKLASGIAPVVDMQAAGVAVGLGSDGAASNNTLDMLEQMRLAAMLQKHERGDATLLPRGTALRMATHDGARVLRQGHELGRIAEGWLADLVLVRLDGAHVQPVHDVLAALVYAVRASDVDTTIVDGRVLMQDRRLVSLDKAQILREVNARATRLGKRDHGQRIQQYR